MKKLSHLIAGAVVLFGLTGCHSSQLTPLQYFVDVPAELTTVVNEPAPIIAIAPGDELFISVTSLVPRASAPFNMPLSNTVTAGELMNATSTPQAVSYIVNSQGNITMPILGSVHVEGMTTEQLQEYLTKLISKQVQDPVVRVELVNFTINVLGEVNRPTRIHISKQRFNILEALAAAGDLTQYGERSNVLLIRELPDGNQQRVRLNLNDASVLTSPYFYLQPNDAIYVSPNEIKKDNARYNTNDAFKISVISTIVSGVSVIASLIIAVAVK